MISAASVGIIYKRDHPPAELEAEKLEKWLREEKAVQVFMDRTPVNESRYACSEESTHIPKTVDWVIVLGGDGTLLGAARRVGKYGIPLLGVNLGGLGFLTGVPLKKLYQVVEMMLENRLEIENRLMLKAVVIRDGNEICQFHVLNDVVINKGTLARIIDLDLLINDEFVTTVRADGLIISTPTGSTGYNLSAGGPILYPTIENFILTPICPFTLTNRPIIIPDTDILKIKMRKASEETVVLTFDGQVGFDLLYDDEVVVCKSEEKIKLLKIPDQSYFKILRTKLMWGGVTYNKDEDQ